MLALVSCTTGGTASFAWKTIPTFKNDTPINMVKFATATVLKLSQEYKSSRPPETAVPVLKLY